MNKVTVSVSTLIDAVSKNRTAHRQIFLEALEGFRKKQMETLEAHLEELKAGKLLRVITYLPVPEDHTKDYDRVLKMLDMHQSNSIDISQEDFAKYVMDDWMWKRSFLATNSSYSATAAVANSQLGDDE